MLNWLNDMLITHTYLTFSGTFLFLMFLQLKSITLFFFLKDKRDKRIKKATYEDMN